MMCRAFLVCRLESKLCDDFIFKYKVEFVVINLHRRCKDSVIDYS